MEKHLNNHLPLTLAGHKSYDLGSNRGRVTVGSHCTISCDNNTGHIFLGSDCRVVTANRNREFISIGSNSTVERAHDNAGQLEIGSHSIVHDINHNSGKITIGNHCKIPASFHSNSGKITMGLHCEILATATITGGGALPSAGGGWGSVGSPRYAAAPASPYRRSPVPAPPAPQMGFVVPAAAAIGEPPYPTSPRGSTPVPTPVAPSPGSVTPPCRLCGACKERKRDTAFGCGHLACGLCAHTLKNCHVCHLVITQKIKMLELD